MAAKLTRGVLATVMLMSSGAHAADAQLRALQDEVAKMKKAYEARIGALEAQLAKEKAATPPMQTATTPGAAPVTTQEGTSALARQQQPAGGSGVMPGAPVGVAPRGTFNPSISGVLVGNYTNQSKSPDSYTLGGQFPSGGEGVAPRNFSLGESELTFAASVDHLFRGQLTLSLPPEGDTVEIEEAFVQSLALGGGFTGKAGRYMSGVGYLNSQHSHAWDFADAPLMYNALFGGQLKQDGVQAKWVAPTDLLVELGAEVGRGATFPGTDRDRNAPGMWAGFAHVGGDVGASNSWRAGLSFVTASPRGRAYDDVNSLGDAVTNQFSGRSQTWMADFIWKWAPEGNGSVRNLTLQAEYFRRRESGTLGYDVNGTNLEDAYTGKPSGFYAQAVYQFRPMWRVGYRYDYLSTGGQSIGLIDSGALSAGDLPALTAYHPKRNTLMLDWSPSEFSRVRLQVARDQSAADVTNNQIWLQYIMNLGTHGAHSF